MADIAWISPITFTSGNTLTAAQLNVNLRDNLNETSPAKASAASQWFPAVGANDVRARTINGDTVTTAQSTASTSYTDVATIGPSVTLTTSSHALVFIQAHISHNTAAAVSYASYEVASGTTIAASDTWCVRLQVSATNDDMRAGIAHYQSALTPAGNIFRMKYKTSAGTATFGSRHILVMGM